MNTAGCNREILALPDEAADPFGPVCREALYRSRPDSSHSPVRGRYRRCQPSSEHAAYPVAGQQRRQPQSSAAMASCRTPLLVAFATRWQQLP